MPTRDSNRRPLAPRRRASLVVFALAVSACATSGATRPEQVETRDADGFTITEEVRVSSAVRGDFARAVQMLEQEQYESGIALLAQVAEASPNVTTVHIDLGIAYSRTKDWERAEASIQRALELNPHHPVALNELGILYRKTGRFDEARDSYEKALSSHPDFHFARRNLAILCDMYLADLDCALQHYELYTQAVPDDQSVAMWVTDLRNRTER